VVSLDGRLKLNDFNIGVLMRWNGSQPCGYPARFHNPLWKSPEEIRNTTYVNPALSDVYSLGNLLFYIMTKHQPWTHLEPSGAVEGEEVGRRKLKGILPTFPEKFVGTNKTATRAMLYAVLSCYRTNPAERLTARELAAAMDKALQWVRVRAPTPRRDVMQLFEKHPQKHKRENHHDRTPN
jgi:serine/threonine protein kinase